MLIADAATLEVIGGAGDLEGRLTPAWQGRSLDSLLAQEVAPAIGAIEGAMAVPLAIVPGRSEAFDAIAHVADGRILVELEPTAPQPTAAAALLARLDRFGQSLERAGDLVSLCDRAARAFRELIGYDRVMIYRFLDDGAGVVLAESRDENLSGFLNHHFPATDIPQQARALYVRNRVRVIPDVDYTPAPIRDEALAALDLSDIGLRSVSPTHVQYLKNMGVTASASVSIVKDGLLWGLIACHNSTPRALPYETRAACRTLAGGLARQVRAREEAEAYRERIRLRAAEDVVAAAGMRDMSFDAFIAGVGEDLRGMLGADGFASLHEKHVVTAGRCPPMDAIEEIGAWVAARTAGDPFVTRSLMLDNPSFARWGERASGLLAVSVTADRPALFLWFRAEQREIVEWAGNPHKPTDDPLAELSPRNSFAAWREEVRGQARPWTIGEIEAAGRLKRQLHDSRQSRRLRELNRELAATVDEKEALLLQKDHLLREVNHRVQNSLQLVQAFLALQARTGEDEALTRHLGEAQRRISAVALVHRRLYQADEVENVDLGRYLQELIGEMRDAMGDEWGDALVLDLAPISISADRAINVGLIVTELVINANKYAYSGQPGQVTIALEPYRNQFRLIVADQGGGDAQVREGFGTRMMNAMVQRLGGTIERFDNAPGLRVIVTAPVAG